jgi:hypothetical protein
LVPNLGKKHVKKPFNQQKLSQTGAGSRAANTKEYLALNLARFGSELDKCICEHVEFGRDPMPISRAAFVLRCVSPSLEYRELIETSEEKNKQEKNFMSGDDRSRVRRSR